MASPSAAHTDLLNVLDQVRSWAAQLDRRAGTGDDLRRRAAAALRQVLAETSLADRKSESERRAGRR